MTKIAFTVCSANYLPFAKALADSLIEHNPAYSFIIALADTYNEYDANFFSPHQIIPVTQMQLPELEELNNRYTIFELSCALKPYVALHLLKKYQSCNKLFYFDSDILLYGSLIVAEEKLDHHPLLLTPHLGVPSSQPAAINTELSILKTGIYNSGFWGVNSSEEAIGFLTWWKDRLKNYCFDDGKNGLFVDQLWVNFVPVYVKNSFILSDPGYNLAYWNFVERKLSVQNGSYLVNEKHPLIFFHYSGYNILEPQYISKHQKEFSSEAFPEYVPLFENYVRVVLKNNDQNFFDLPPTMGVVPPPPPEPPPPPPPREKNFFKRKWKKFLKRINH